LQEVNGEMSEALGAEELSVLVGVEMIDVFFIEYIHPGDDQEVMFGKNGVLDEFQQWKERGWVRFVGATAHDWSMARELAGDSRVDVLMHRYNMAHRKAVREVFPVAVKAQTPVVAVTATRWGTLLKPNADWSDSQPTALIATAFVWLIRPCKLS
jgi:aryl-alcohol dehydrogenase-like predicted oxidoreductase